MIAQPLLTTKENQCNRCKFQFMSNKEFADHVVESMCSFLQYTYKCTLCPLSFAHKEQLDDHFELHRLDRFFCQKYCGKYFKSIDECEQHECADHQFDFYKCEVSQVHIKLRYMH